MAILDALTRSFGIPLYIFFGGATSFIETDISIPLVTPEHAYDLAQEIVVHGIKRIKVKVGQNLREDVDRVEAIRNGAPHHNRKESGEHEREYDTMRKRLDVQIDANRFDYIKGESDKSGKAMNVISDKLIAIGIAVKTGEIIEQQSLPVIREIMQTELRKQFAQQRIDVREDMSLEFTNEIKTIQRVSDNRLASLIVRTLRDANIARRLMFALLAKAHGPYFANKAYLDASEKAGRDIASRSTKGENES